MVTSLVTRITGVSYCALPGSDILMMAMVVMMTVMRVVLEVMVPTQWVELASG
jgi:hypothetical protein